MSGPLVTLPQAGSRIGAPAGAVTILTRAEQTDGALTVIENLIPPGAGPPLHVHRHEDEFAYVLEGRFRFQLGDELHDAPAGSFVFIPRGLEHGWQNVDDKPSRFLFGFSPGSRGMERFFERSAQLPEGKRRSEAFARFAADAGIEVVGAPMGTASPAAQSTPDPVS